MNPEKQIKYSGITFGQLYAILTLLVAVIAAWVQINVRVASIEVIQSNEVYVKKELKESICDITKKLDQSNEKLNQLIGATKYNNDIKINSYKN